MKTQKLKCLPDDSPLPTSVRVNADSEDDLDRELWALQEEQCDQTMEVLLKAWKLHLLAERGAQSAPSEAVAGSDVDLASSPLSSGSDEPSMGSSTPCFSETAGAAQLVEVRDPLRSDQ